MAGILDLIDFFCLIFVSYFCYMANFRRKNRIVECPVLQKKTDDRTFLKTGN